MSIIRLLLADNHAAVLEEMDEALEKFINRLFKTTTIPKLFLPVDTRVYCLGDIHGRYDLLAALIEKIKQETFPVTLSWSIWAILLTAVYFPGTSLTSY